MKRREAVQMMALLTGGVISASTLSVLLESCNEEHDRKGDNKFSDDEVKMISAMSDIIIPKTNVPGALEAGVPTFIPMMLASCYSENDRKQFHEGLKEFNLLCQNKYKKSFLMLPKDKQQEAVKYLDHLVLGANNSLPKNRENLNFYQNMKSLTLLGYYSSKSGATEALRYIQIPGHYDGCISYQNGDKEWAT